MKHNRARIIALIVLFLAIGLATNLAHAQTPAHLWSRGIGDTGADYGYSVATDASGNVFVTGYFQGTVDFGGGPLVSAGGTDMFVAKYSPAGSHLWSQRFGGANDAFGYSIATDASGNVLVTGFFEGTADFGGGPLVSAGVYDLVVAKYDPAGTHLWSQRFGGTGYERGHSIATDTSGNLFVAGNFQDTVDFGGGPLVSAGNYDIFVAKYDPTGTHLWSQRFGSTDGDDGYSVATDALGNVLLTGDFQGTVDFGGGPLVSSGSADIIVAKYGPTGTHVWSQNFGSTSVDVGYSVATDAAGNVFLTGYFQGTTDFGGGLLVSAGSSDIVVAKYDPAGTHLWSQRFGDTSGDRGYSVATDASGNVIVTGYFTGTADFGGGTLVSTGSGDIVVAKYSATGTHLWSGGFGGTSLDRGFSVATDPSGGVFVTGIFQGSANPGGAALVSAGGFDIFVARYAASPAEPAIANITDVGNDQGGRVYVDWVPSGLDMAEAVAPATGYNLYRRVDDPALVATMHDAGLSPSAAELFAPEGQVYVTGGMTPTASAAFPPGIWALVGSAFATQSATYRMEATTAADSGATGTNYAVFLVTAHTPAPLAWYASNPDSGYSVDNLAPGVPGGLLYNSGILSWNESSARDFDYFTVYGANVEDFGAATIVDYSVATTMDVTAAGYVFYFVTATDFAGNEGQPGKVNTLTGIGGTPASYVLSLSNFPNPFNPRTTLSYTVPARGDVSVTIYDARGARVATLVNNETRNAGAYRVDWNGRADSGLALPSGIYFARIQYDDVVRSRKMVLLK